MNLQIATASSASENGNNALDKIGSMVRACIQCGTCTGSCPNALEMDMTPRKMWRLVNLGRLAEIMASRTFILCSDCYTCTLRCPRGLPLTDAMEALKGIAFARRERRHRSSRLFYEKFMQTVRRHGRIREMAFMTRYFTAMKSPTVPLRFAPLGIKLMGKGKVEIGLGKTVATPLDALFEKVADLERTTCAPLENEGHG
ncbi:MAG: 4Fe-4S dicluster domain-containing protein [Desulfosarcina sp.]|nr:4Fe-4S dicluster domain-containing protein [Desulfosarcina sp.]